MIDEIKTYYDNLAKNYDNNRFENSYGKYLDYQERAFFNSRITKDDNSKILDLGCGTGRFLNFANFGVDISPNMIAESKLKFPNVEFREGLVSNIPFENDFFETIFSMHVIMHLKYEITMDFLDESHKKLKNNGKLIFDFPSKKRRKLMNFKSQNWHAANSFSIDEIKKMIQKKWILTKHQGILFLPIHRFPKFSRAFFVKIDTLLCKSFLKEYASYCIIELKKI
jgi:SAM-dependent methyltransferase